MEVYPADYSVGGGGSEMCGECSPGTTAKRLTLWLSAPEEGEECSIAMAPMSDYRLECLPPDTPQVVLTERPELSKATIEGCKHSFSALTLLYHFARNEMTCPLCRHGHTGVKMGVSCMPEHLALGMAGHLRTAAQVDQRELVENERQSILSMLDNEVNEEDFMRMNRQTLILYAYAGDSSFSPLLVQEVALESSLEDGVLRFSSFTHSIRELGRNLRHFPVPLRSFEMVVSSQRISGVSLALVRSQRFELAPGTNALECVGGRELERIGVRLEVTTSRQGPGGLQALDGSLDFAGIALTMRSHLLYALAVQHSEPLFRIMDLRLEPPPEVS
jgi:hypothetical protein